MENSLICLKFKEKRCLKLYAMIPSSWRAKDSWITPCCFLLKLRKLIAADKEKILWIFPKDLCKNSTLKKAQFLKEHLHLKMIWVKYHPRKKFAAIKSIISGSLITNRHGIQLNWVKDFSNQFKTVKIGTEALPFLQGYMDKDLETLLKNKF